MKTKHIIFVITGVLTVIAVYLYLIIPIWKEDPNEAGAFGDMFGTVTTFLSFGTIILLLQSLKYQRKELKNSKEELRLTREEMIKQTDINRLQQETTKLQRIDNTFFNLLEVNYKIKLSSDLSISGKYTWKRFEKSFIQENFGRMRDQLYFDENGYAVFSNDRFNDFRLVFNYGGIGGNLLHCYNSTLIVIKFIKESGVTVDKMKFYVETFAALYTPAELCVLLVFFRLGVQSNETYVNTSLVNFAIENGFFDNVERNEFPHYSFINLMSTEIGL